MINNSKTFFSQLVIKIHLILLLIFLSACNSSSLQVSDGLGGTGVTMGRVTAFGSIYVNGIKFNTDNATFMRNGIRFENQDDFNTGEIVKIIGIRDENRKTGIATEVVFSNILEGTVTAIASKNIIEIMGQKITTDKLTVFHGFELLSDLALNNQVEVSGFVTKTGIIATSIKLISEQFIAGANLKLEGYISDLNLSAQTFKLNQLKIDYSLAEFKQMTLAELKEGLYLIINTQQEIQNNTLQASSIAPFNETLEAGVYYEIEGYVTEPDALSNFAINLDIAPPASSEASFDSNVANGLIMNSHIIIRGTVNQKNILEAKEVKILDNNLGNNGLNNSHSDITLEANIESIDVINSRIVLLDKSITINNFTLFSDDTQQSVTTLNLQQFVVGETVLIIAHYADGKLIADRLSKIASTGSVLFSGLIDQVNPEAQTLSVFGKNISVNEDTLYLDAEANDLSKTVYFSRLKTAETRIEVIGKLTENGDIIANELTLIQK